MKYKLVERKNPQQPQAAALRISFSSEGVATEEAFNVGKISNIRVLFTPSPVLRKSIENIKFEKA
ncbi:MAG: hypothetical protein LBH12_03375 [Dysgonamonadaceae bacterium]|jgi:hypothetical protein|nr:hypothetical protein [Dysgonamonadaceae bacterium]